jgi:IMP cyclohydrolase
MQAGTLALHNFESRLRQNPYPGRGLVIGRSDADEWVIVYWIMGRSPQSRNRRFVAEGSTLRTELMDASLVTDPSLIIYEAMLDLPGIYLVSNGDQTRTVYDALQKGGTFESALATREREPDAPNFTPRISGMLDLRAGAESGAVTLSILKASPLDSALTDRFTFSPAIPTPGFGFGLTTYDGDGSPLPSFAGTALLLPLTETPEKIMDFYWGALNADNRVALAVKRITIKGSDIFIRNRE